MKFFLYENEQMLVVAGTPSAATKALAEDGFSNGRSSSVGLVVAGFRMQLSDRCTALRHGR